MRVWKNKSDAECSLHETLGEHFVRTPQGDKFIFNINVYEKPETKQDVGAKTFSHRFF